MPRYYFDFDDGRSLMRDETGTDFASATETKLEAARMLPSIASHEMRSEGTSRFLLTVGDEAGLDVFTASRILANERRLRLRVRPAAHGLREHVEPPRLGQLTRPRGENNHLSCPFWCGTHSASSSFVVRRGIAGLRNVAGRI